RIEQALAVGEAGRREAVAGKARRPENGIDGPEIEAADAVAALVGQVRSQAQAEAIGRFGIELEAARVFALPAGAVALDAVMAGKRAGDANRRLVANGK